MTAVAAPPSARPLARVAAGLGVTSIFTSVLGWGLLALAVAGSHQFTNTDTKYGFMVIGWLLLGVVAVLAWIATAVTAGIATARARRTSEPASVAGVALALVVVIPVSWLCEWLGLALWFGGEALSGPWFYLH